MEKFTAHTGTAVPLRRSNVDTDQIIPAVYLKRVTRTGFEDGLFSAWRDDPAFVLNNPAYAGRLDPRRRARVRHRVVARARRLGAAGLGLPGGHRPAFGDIFRGNALKEGLLPVELPRRPSRSSGTCWRSEPRRRVTVDLVERQVRGPEPELGRSRSTISAGGGCWKALTTSD